MDMDTATTIIKGGLHKPAVILIHGLGMDKRIWEAPEEARILGGRFPIDTLLCKELPSGLNKMNTHEKISSGKPPEKLNTIFHDLKELGHTIIAYSQQRPSAGIDVAVSELRGLINRHEEYFKSGVILIGHSRGGLVAGKYIASGDKRIRGLFTLATPHKGSRMAQWATYLSPLVSYINPLLPEAEKGPLAHTAKKISEFLLSRAVNELLPEAPFFKTLENVHPAGVHCLSIGGNDPTLFIVYSTLYEELGEHGESRYISRPEKLFSIPEFLEKIVPGKLFPEEMKKGLGDGLVTAESARLPYADEHFDFGVNHAGILFEAGVRAALIRALDKS